MSSQFRWQIPDELVVPKVYRQASTSRVLTMERFYGTSLSNAEAVKQISDNPEALLNETLNTWFSSLTQCQIYHADLHAGNVMVLEDGRVGFIDFGIVGRVPEDVWGALLSLGVAIPARDFLAIAEALATMGATDIKVNIPQFAKDMESLVDEIFAFCRSTGPSISPFNAWTLSKSIETLPLRMERHSENALKLFDRHSY